MSKWRIVEQTTKHGLKIFAVQKKWFIFWFDYDYFTSLNKAKYELRHQEDVVVSERVVS